MSTVPNAFGVALGTPPPSLAYSAVGLPFGTFVKPGARIAAYVRSTGRQDLDDLHISDNLVQSIDEGLKRCRAGAGDVVLVLPGHTETHSVSGDIWPNKVAGAKVVGCGTPGGSNNPNVTLSHVGASVALDVADFSVMGLNINSATAAVTGAIAVTAAGCSLVGNFVSFTGALGANPGIAVTGAANCRIAGNHIVCNSTDPVIEVTGAGSTNMEICGNLVRQSQATSGGDCINVANTAGISGFITGNMMKSAVAGTPGTSIGLVVGVGASPTVFNGENYDVDDAVTAAVLSTGG